MQKTTLSALKIFLSKYFTENKFKLSTTAKMIPTVYEQIIYCTWLVKLFAECHFMFVVVQ